MKINQLISIVALLVSLNSFAQLGIKETNAAPNTKAMLDVESPNKGVLIPRLSTTNRDAIAAPPAGLLIYNSTTNLFNYWNGSSWTDFNSNPLTLPFEGTGVNNSGGQAGLMKIVNTGTGNGLYVKAGTGGQLNAGQSFAAYFESSQNGIFAASGVGNLALKTAGGLQFLNNSGGTNKILTSIDANGTAVWQNTAILNGLEVNGSTIIGINGTALTEIIKVTQNKDIGNTAGGGEAIITFDIPNVLPGSSIICSPKQNLPLGILLSYALCTVAGQVQVKFYNAKIAAIDPPAQDFHITVIR